ncbi:MAG: HAMP domain-containing sensor histidine kinase [Ekhidna sp.]
MKKQTIVLILYLRFMSSSVRNIVLILMLAVLLPIAIFSAIEVSSLNENEETLEEVYREQLDGIIFSINQYSADLFDFYIQQIDYTYSQGGIEALRLPNAIKGNLAIDLIALQPGANSVALVDFNDQTQLGELNLDSVFQSNQDVIERLIRYKATDYIKQEVIGQPSNTGSLQMSLIVVGEHTPCLVFIDPVAFVEDLLAPKIQQITTQKINVSVRDVNTDQLVYSSEKAPVGIIQTQTLIKVVGYEIAVSLQTQSVTDIIAYRTKRNLITLGIMVLVILLGMVLVIRNLRKQMQLNKAKADFIANVSHEIRTPLSLISMFNETLLLDRVKDEKKKEYYEIISKESARLKNIVNKILSFSQIDAGKKSYHFEIINPDDLVNEVINSYSYHLSDKGFNYKLDLKESVKINADPEAFSEVLINLIDNAMKYSGDVKEIKIESSFDESSYFLTIIDRGVGIDRKHQKNIFDKFYRVEGGNVHNIKGTGLGLSLVLEIVKAHQAEISVTSELSKGTTFTLKFPKA